MFKLESWIAEPKFIKRYSNSGFAAFATRSEPAARYNLPPARMFNAFAWKI